MLSLSKHDPSTSSEKLARQAGRALSCNALGWCTAATGICCQSMAAAARMEARATGAALVVAADASDAGPAADHTPGERDPDAARQTILLTHRVLLLQPPDEHLIDELFDYYVILSERAATGEIPPAWAAYLYVSYWRDAVHDHAAGRPRLTLAELHLRLDQQVEFFYIRKRPEAQPSAFGAWVWQAAPPQ